MAGPYETVLGHETRLVHFNDCAIWLNVAFVACDEDTPPAQAMRCSHHAKGHGAACASIDQFGESVENIDGSAAFIMTSIASISAVAAGYSFFHAALRAQRAGVR
ncbi:hypothetical protein NHH03_06745 [Stieleria sp. TO1_6]|uniref:hypothetical protein n=1 Tax=Stieleria tagensis TaxID=2956795 RepID=UPI00209B9FF7|nr:hypothetical protein [Stieleria tagensis]MCO8121429.1 hypothetical protein [Stieleria tagensis]